MADILFSAETAELKRKINFVRNGLGSSKTDLPVMLIRCNVTGNKLTMFAANKEMFCRTEIKIARGDGEDHPDGSFSILGGKLVSLINQIESERVSFKADPENLEAQAGFLTVNMVLYDGASLKQIEAGVSDHLSQEGDAIERASFEEALSCAKSCTTTNSIRPDVTHIELRGGRMLSSDGRKIMIYSHDGFNAKIKFKATATSLNSIIAAVKNIDQENLAIIEGTGYFFLKGGMNAFSLGVRKVERDFPAVESYIQNTGAADDEISVDKNVLTAALNGVALGLDSDEVKVTFDADGQKTEAYLEVSSKNSLGRRSFERASCGRLATAQKPISFPISFRHMLDTLMVFKGDSVVDLFVMLPKNLLMVRDSTSAREVNTIIPFRTDSQIEAEKREAAEAEAARKKDAPPESKTDSAEEGAADATAATDQEDIDVA